MTAKDKSTIQRMLGIIEGISFIIDDKAIAGTMLECVDTIANTIDKDGEDNAAD